MIRAIVRQGMIHPIDPLPPEWSDGRELWIEPADPEPSDDPEEIDRWYQELQALSAGLYAPGERERIQAVLAEADAQAKDWVRREMGLPEPHP